MRTSVTYRAFNATLFVVLCALSTWAGAQKVYKCSDSYSQLPCVGGRALTLDDSRDTAQKQQTDAATVRDAKQARLLEAERTARELAAIAPPPVLSNTKRIGPKAKSVEYFVAQVPGAKQKPKRKKPGKKRVHPLV